MNDLIWGKYFPKPLKVGVNRQFQTKTQTSKNRNIPETVNPIKSKFEKQAGATSRVVYHYPRANLTWLTIAILKIAMTSSGDPIRVKFGSHMQNDMPTATK